MALQILSDLHLEAPKAYDVFAIVPRAPHLALLGDIGNAASHRDEYLGFLTRQLRQFTTVLLVPGNHEPYGSDWDATLDVLRAFERDVARDLSLGDFILLDREVYRLPGSNVSVLGCSLFSRVPAESEGVVSFGVNDFYRIGDGWDVERHNDAHGRDLTWLNAVVEAEGGRDMVVLTHWSPSVDGRAVDPRHADSRIGSAFATDLSGEACFRHGGVKVWAFGHTHYNCDFVVEREEARPLRLVANQRGYYFAQAEGFDVDKTVDIGRPLER